MTSTEVHPLPKTEIILHVPASALPAKGGRPSGRGSRRAQPASAVKANNSGVVFMVGQMRELLLYRAEFLRHSGFGVLTSQSKADAIATIKRGGFDAAILSYTLSNDTVEELGELIRQQYPHCPVISISRSGSEDRRLHPDEIVVGDEGPDALMAALRRALRKRLQ